MIPIGLYHEQLLSAEGSKQVPTCDHLLTYNIPHTNSHFGLGQTDEIVAGRGDAGTILKYKYSTSKYTEVWEKTLPAMFPWGAKKFITPSGNIVLHEVSGKTTVFTRDMKKTCEHVATEMKLLYATDDSFFVCNYYAARL